MGRATPDNANEPFNMAILALRNSAFTNGVSRLHGEVSRLMVAEGYAGFPVDEIPIDHVTNGIHLRSWMSHDMAELLDRYLGSDWLRGPDRHRDLAPGRADPERGALAHPRAAPRAAGRASPASASRRS